MPINKNQVYRYVFKLLCLEEKIMFLHKKRLLPFIVSAFFIGVLLSTSTLLATSPVAAASVAGSTNCPAPGQGRAAVLPSLALGKHQNLIYQYIQVATSGAVVGSTLRRYDVTTRQKTSILFQSGREIFLHRFQPMGSGYSSRLHSTARIARRTRIVKYN